MKKVFSNFLLLCMLTTMLIGLVPSASAYTSGDPCRLDLRAFIQDRSRRAYVEMMIDHVKVSFEKVTYCLFAAILLPLLLVLQ